MDNVLKYLATRQAELLDNYNINDRSKNCGWVSLQVARLFLESGKAPYILEFVEEIKRGPFIERTVLWPKIFENTVPWSAHDVCCYDGQAYDPFLGRAIGIVDYPLEMFGQKVKRRIFVPKKEIRRYAGKIRTPGDVAAH